MAHDTKSASRKSATIPDKPSVKPSTDVEAAPRVDQHATPEVMEHKDVVVRQPDRHPEAVNVVRVAADQLKSLAPMLGREGTVIVGGSFPAHAAVMAGANPLYVYGSAIVFAVLYMIQTWRHP